MVTAVYMDRLARDSAPTSLSRNNAVAISA